MLGHLPLRRHKMKPANGESVLEMMPRYTFFVFFIYSFVYVGIFILSAILITDSVTVENINIISDLFFICLLVFFGFLFSIFANGIPLLIVFSVRSCKCKYFSLSKYSSLIFICWHILFASFLIYNADSIMSSNNTIDLSFCNRLAWFFASLACCFPKRF